MRLFDYLDLRFQELRNAVSQNLTEPPENPVEGLFYYNTEDKRWYIFDGEKWIDCTLQLIDFSCSVTGITYDPETGEFSLDEGYVIPTIQQFQDLWTAIADETEARINADNILQSNIDAEELARINADNILQSNIDAEETSRINADNILQSNIDAEASTRASADNTLSGRIDRETTERKEADRVLNEKIERVIRTDKHYTFEQATPAKIWVINHGMNKKPSVTVVDSAESVVGPDDIVYPDLNIVVLTFLTEFAGRAYCN